MLVRTFVTGAVTLTASLAVQPSKAADAATPPPAPVVATPQISDAQLTKLQSEVVDAKVTAAVANAQSAQDQKSATDAANREADLKAGKLIRYGITAGVALMVEGPSAWAGADAKTHGWRTGWMPYFAAVPAFWFQTTEHAKYCASQYGDGDSALATTVAYAQSKRRFLAANPAFQREADAAKTPQEVSAVEAKIEAQMNSDGGYWDPKKGATCVPNIFGFYLGAPTSDDGRRYSVNGGAEVSGKLTNSFSFGITALPTSYINLLLGWNVGHIDMPNDQQARVVSWMFGIGGNVDLFNTSLFK